MTPSHTPPVKVTPLLFTGVMVRALRDRVKNQTRRPMDEVLTQPPVVGFQHLGGARWQQALVAGDGGGRQFSCRYGGVDDLLYVREACRASRNADDFDGVVYLADKQFVPIDNTEEAATRWAELNRYGIKNGHGRHGRPVPNIHQPRWASRMTLVVMEVRCERLLAISEDDARQEGVRDRASYLALWDSIHGAGDAQRNPWVYAIDFTIEDLQVDRYIATLRAA